MKHLIVHNVGPLKKVDIDLKRINVIIGPQGSGKSCVLKIACYCTWVEKRIEIEQSEDYFKKDGVFVKELVRFHKLDNFINNDSFIEYESKFMLFSYNGKSKIFDFKWKKDRWKYKRTKICYVPAERNLVAVIPNWYEVKFPENNIKNFLTDWENVRKSINDFAILNLGVKYHYDIARRKDEVIIGNNLTVDFTNMSSGYQSLIPICALLQYFFKEQYLIEKQESIENTSNNLKILKRIYHERYEEKAKQNKSYQEKVGNKIKVVGEITLSRIGNWFFSFYDKNDAEECKKYYSNYTETDHCDIFLEEPELSLFPSTQHDLLYWLIENCNGERKHSLFIATHSPYIMTSINNLLEAGNVIAEDSDKRIDVEKIISKNMILSYKHVSAFMIDSEGNVKSIMEDDNHLISAIELDKVSDIISDEFDKLLDL